MSLRHRKPDAPAPETGDHLDRLGQIRPHSHNDDDDRPSREDIAPQLSQAFSSPVPLPRFLQTRRERKRGRPVN